MLPLAPTLPHTPARRSTLWIATLLFGSLLVSGAALAGWSSDPAVNTPVATATGDQILPKVAPTSDGGCWISWFDSIGNGFDVRVQRLDAAGDEQLPPNGVLVADRSFSSVQDYGLDTDDSDAALLAFRDDRGTGIQITAAKIALDGTPVWGASGVQMTSTSDFVASPKIAGPTDGGAVVAWTQNGDARLEKLNAAGAPQWGGVTLMPAAGSYTVADLHDAGGDVLLSFVHQTGSFGSPKHLYAQKLDAAGALLWGASHVAVFDGGSLQFGNFPPFEPDGSGGAVFSWYDTASFQLQCYAQHVLANGTEAFPHNGSAASTNATRVRVSPSVSFDPGSGETFLFWEEQNSTQSQFGLYGQKFDAGGTRQWTNEGAALIPVGSDEIRMVRNLPSAGGAFVFYMRSTGFGQDRLFGARVNAVGTFDIGPFDVASTPSEKSRLDVARSTSGFAILAWSDGRNDPGDVFAQNVNADGSLGAPAVAVPEGPTATFFLSAPRPNPARSAVTLELVVDRAGMADVFIFDSAGRRVRTVAGQRLTRGSNRLAWDLRDSQGFPVAPGVYFARVEADGLAAMRSVVRIR